MVDPFGWMDDGISTKNRAVQWVFWYWRENRMKLTTTIMVSKYNSVYHIQQ